MCVIYEEEDTCVSYSFCDAGFFFSFLGRMTDEGRDGMG
jgi:hypothetical protein